MGRIGKFIAAQWHDIKGNAKWWAILLVFSIGCAICKYLKHAGMIMTMLSLLAYLTGVAFIIWLSYRDWCRREVLKEKVIAEQRQQEGNRLTGETMREWLKNGKNRKFRGPPA